MPNATIAEHTDLIEGTRLRYIKDVERTNPKRRRAEFLCTCGNITIADVNYVRYGDVKSCGCLKAELLVAKNTVHNNAKREGASGAYRSWTAMLQRVKTNKNYKDRQVCERWKGKDGFSNFLADMGDRPEGHSIERKDNNLGYFPENCKWATKKEQASNTCRSVVVTLDGKSDNLFAWCEKLGIPYYLVKQRKKRGMSLEEALTTPIDKSKQNRKKT